jgi:hypothetical protein
MMDTQQTQELNFLLSDASKLLLVLKFVVLLLPLSLLLLSTMLVVSKIAIARLCSAPAAAQSAAPACSSWPLQDPGR